MLKVSRLGSGEPPPGYGGAWMEAGGLFMGRPIIFRIRHGRGSSMPIPEAKNMAVGIANSHFAGLGKVLGWLALDIRAKRWQTLALT